MNLGHHMTPSVGHVTGLSAHLILPLNHPLAGHMILPLQYVIQCPLNGFLSAVDHMTAVTTPAEVTHDLHHSFHYCCVLCVAKDQGSPVESSRLAVT